MSRTVLMTVKVCLIETNLSINSGHTMHRDHVIHRIFWKVEPAGASWRSIMGF